MSSASHDPLLTEIVDRVVETLHPQRVYLFGSRALGESNDDSDYDLMVLVANRSEPIAVLAKRAHSALWGVGASADIVVWDAERFDSRLHLRASLPATVIRDGRLIYAA